MSAIVKLYFVILVECVYFQLSSQVLEDVATVDIDATSEIITFETAVWEDDFVVDNILDDSTSTHKCKE
jgi:hypothetical protein